MNAPTVVSKLNGSVPTNPKALPADYDSLAIYRVTTRFAENETDLKVLMRYANPLDLQP